MTPHTIFLKLTTPIDTLDPRCWLLRTRGSHLQLFYLFQSRFLAIIYHLWEYSLGGRLTVASRSVFFAGVSARVSTGTEIARRLRREKLCWFSDFSDVDYPIFPSTHRLRQIPNVKNKRFREDIRSPVFGAH